MIIFILLTNDIKKNFKNHYSEFFFVIQINYYIIFTELVVFISTLKCVLKNIDSSNNLKTLSIDIKKRVLNLLVKKNLSFVKQENFKLV